eukprot:TRINITY_DN14876_c0_g1_i2.p1 TRINITY_DN14876_c0_g1~~TRINITY_DN14876_c0_g1_i2.p1  ORF type:complete len:233 (+),score=12.99 TRINITY_DN14876_c0_g1_i2:97-699(+)
MDEERVPMLVGCGRHTARLRNEDISKFPSPMDLVTRAVNIAAEDLGIGPSRAAAALREADAFATVNICAVGVPAMSGGDHKFYTLYPNAPLTLAQRCLGPLHRGAHGSRVGDVGDILRGSRRLDPREKSNTPMGCGTDSWDIRTRSTTAPCWTWNCAHLTVDQSAALIIMSVAEAMRCVYLRSIRTQASHLRRHRGFGRR